jgi:hypothetical protein
MSKPAPRIYEIGCRALLALRTELAACGALIDPRLELRRGNGLLCHYDLVDGHIYLASPDPETARGKFELLLLRSLLRFDSTDEILRFLELITPWLVAHEAGHHLRLRGRPEGPRGARFGPPLAEEERIASQLAIAFVKRYLTLEQQDETLSALAKAIANLSYGLRSAQGASEINHVHGLIHHVYQHMNWFYEDLLIAEEHQIADFVQIYLKL